jgi:hypothetical protein
MVTRLVDGGADTRSDWARKWVGEGRRRAREEDRRRRVKSTGPVVPPQSRHDGRPCSDALPNNDPDGSYVLKGRTYGGRSS